MQHISLWCDFHFTVYPYFKTTSLLLDCVGDEAIRQGERLRARDAIIISALRWKLVFFSKINAVIAAGLKFLHKDALWRAACEISVSVNGGLASNKF